jgi:hypothetical protein
MASSSSSENSEGGRRRLDMEHLIVPMAVRAKLGEGGSEGLVDMFSAYQQFSTDRYEKRVILTEAALRQELRDGLAAIRVELAETKAEVIKWTLLMWIGQFAALAGVMAFLLRPR